MSRTLEEMKLSRGGICHQCEKSIMDPSEKDHTYCNDCWDALLAHKYEDWNGTCDLCDAKPKEHRIHNLSWAETYLKGLTV